MKFKWQLFWLITFFCVLGTIALAYIAFTSNPPSGSTIFIEVTKTLFLCLGGIGVILPVYINATNSIEARYENRIENTFTLLQKWDDSHFLAARKLTRELKSTRQSISDNQLIEQINDNQELRQSVILLFNYFDQVRFSLTANRVDKVAFKSSLGAVISDIIIRFEPFIKTISNEAGIQDLEQLKKLLS